MSSSDGMNSSTQVSIVKCVWVPVITSCQARHEMVPLPVDPTTVVLT
jgi:hypothetical protein